MLKDASLRGLQQVWFEDKMISIPHISFIEERRESTPDFPELPEMTYEQKEKARKKIEEIRKTLKEKLTMN